MAWKLSFKRFRANSAEESTPSPLISVVSVQSIHGATESNNYSKKIAMIFSKGQVVGSFCILEHPEDWKPNTEDMEKGIQALLADVNRKPEISDFIIMSSSERIYHITDGENSYYVGELNLIYYLVYKSKS